MSIRLKILITTILAIVITLAGVIFTVSLQLNKTLTSNFAVTGDAQLNRVNAYVNLFFTNTLNMARQIAALPVTLENLDNLTDYSGYKTKVKTIGEELPEAEKELYYTLRRFQTNYPAIALLYVGSSNGGFTQTPDDTLWKEYNPTERGWFIDTMKAGKPVLTEVYLSDSGESVCTATAPIKAIGTTTGVVGIDISLTTLTEELGNATIGQTGQMLLIDERGVIVNDFRLSSKEFAGWAGYEITDEKAIPDATVRKAFAHVQSMKPGTTAEITFLGKEWLTRTTKTSENWTLVMFQEKDEIFSDALGITLNIFQIGLIILVITAVFAYLLSRSIATPVAKLANAAQQVALGDLKAIPEESKEFTGELGVLHKSLKSMVKKLVELIDTAQNKIKEAEAALELSRTSLQEAENAKAQAESARREGVLQTAQELSSIVSQLSHAAHNLSKELDTTESNVSVQKMRVTETATAMSQMNAAIGEIAGSISRTSTLAETARDESVTGKRLVHEVIASINAVDNHSKTMHKSLEALGEQVTDIGKIMTVINDIADQTNLLALNAAIEAARAGDAGRGFAVVADEVRKLAENTMQATKQVGDAIKTIQRGTDTNMQAMQQTTTFVNKSTEVATKAGESLSNIESLVAHTADEVRAIAAASEEQSATVEEINHSTTDVSKLANQISEGSHRSHDAILEVTKLAEEVEHIINNLRKG